VAAHRRRSPRRSSSNSSGSSAGNGVTGSAAAGIGDVRTVEAYRGVATSPGSEARAMARAVELEHPLSGEPAEGIDDRPDVVGSDRAVEPDPTTVGGVPKSIEDAAAEPPRRRFEPIGP